MLPPLLLQQQLFGAQIRGLRLPLQDYRTIMLMLLVSCHLLPCLLSLLQLLLLFTGTLCS